jgi:hypothetical protein
MGAITTRVITKNQVTVTRTTRTASLTDGYGSDVDVSGPILAVIQPMSGKELRNVPEGQNTLDWRNIWSLVEIKARELITDPEGNQFTIQSVEFWREGPFYKATAVRADDDAFS